MASKIKLRFLYTIFILFLIADTSFAQGSTVTVIGVNVTESTTTTANSTSTATMTTTTTTEPPPRRPPKPATQQVGSTDSHCVTDGVSDDSIKNCGYSVDGSQSVFKLMPCPWVGSLANCTSEEFGYGNCMMCLTALNSGKQPLNGRVEITSSLINETSPQCQLRVRVTSEGSADIGSWKVIARHIEQGQAKDDHLVASLYGSYIGEVDMVAQLHSMKNIAIVIVAEQWSNFTGRKAIGTISFEFCNDVPSTPSSNAFTCVNGRTVSEAVVCDFVDDCGDSSDEQPETAGCGHRTEHCMFPYGCPTLNGWNPIDGRIVPRLSSGLTGFLPPAPQIAPGVSLPMITDQSDFPHGLPLLVDLTTRMTQSDDTFVFTLPEIDAIRDLHDNTTKCWLRFHYYVPTGMHQAEISVVDGANKGGYMAPNLEAVASSNWIREQIELPLFEHHASTSASESAENRVEFYKPQIRIRSKEGSKFAAKSIVVTEIGMVGIWGLSFSQGCRPVHTYCALNLPDRSTIGCRNDELTCALKAPNDLSKLVDSMLMPKDGHRKDFCYPPMKKCDFVCDCPDCSDEAECGGTCDLAYPETCGWLVGDNWVWPPAGKALCNGQPCIITTPDTMLHYINAPEFLPSRALLSNMYEWLNPNNCTLTFQYRLWPGTGLSLIHMSPVGDTHWLFYGQLPANTTSVTGWQTAVVDFSGRGNITLQKFRLAFLPESSAFNAHNLEHSQHSIVSNQPVGLAKISFSPECGAPSSKSTTSCPPKAASCQMGANAGACTALIEEPIYACQQDFIQCVNTSSIDLAQVADFHNLTCEWQQPSSEASSQPEIATSEIFRFRPTEKSCIMGSCFAVVTYDLHNDQAPSSYMSLVLSEQDVTATFGESGTVLRRQRIWHVSAADYKSIFNRTSDDFVARIPINYCPTDLTPTTNRIVRIELEGTTGADNLKIKINDVKLTKGCFVEFGTISGKEIVCRDGYERCTTDQRCFPRNFICGWYAVPESIRQMCPPASADSGSTSGFKLESSCFRSTGPSPDTSSNTPSLSGGKIAGVVVGALASIILVVLASYAITKRVIKWYRAGGGHRPASSRSSGHENGTAAPFARNDGHHFRQLVGVDNSTQMMLDMLVNDEESNW